MKVVARSKVPVDLFLLQSLAKGAHVVCGLLATSLAEEFTEEQWSTARSLLSTRGPDDQGDVRLGALRFAHTRLSIIGLGVEGHQPSVSDDGNTVLVYNGEIYNYRELARELGVRTHSDTAVLHHILRRRRWDLLSRARGMYAFVFFDAVAKRMWAARDPFGIKPLYRLDHRDGHVSFASSVAALQVVHDGAEVDMSSLVAFAALGIFDGRRTPFQRIKKVRPGQVESWRTEDTPALVEQHPIVGRPDGPILSVPDALADSVDSHLVADVDIGVLLSGGIDSTLLASLAVESGRSIRTFTLVNPSQREYDESLYARRNAALLGCEHYEVPLTKSGLLGQIEPLIHSTGEPFGDSHLLLSVLCASVREVGTKVVLAGEGADELFGGYRRYQFERVQATRVGNDSMRGISGVAAKLLSNTWLGNSSSPRARVFRSAAQGAGYLGHTTLLNGEWPLMLDVFPDIGPQAYAESEADWGLQSPALEACWDLPDYRTYDLLEWLPNAFLDKSDRASMLNSVEVRVPFLDPNVARTVQDRSDWTVGKPELRAELLARLPQVLLPKRKRGLSMDLRDLLDGDLGGRIQRQLLDPGSILRRLGLMDPDLKVASRARSSPSLAFRLAILDAWEEVILG